MPVRYNVNTNSTSTCHRVNMRHLNAPFLNLIQSESTRELNDMFYGLLFAYDEGLVKDDTVLASAVWRNLFHASKSTATAQVCQRPVARRLSWCTTFDPLTAMQLACNNTHTHTHTHARSTRAIISYLEKKHRVCPYLSSLHSNMAR